MALGVVSFAFVALVGMIPVGLNTFSDAIDATVSSQIAQAVMTEVRQAKFSELGKFDVNPDDSPGQPKADYFFDEEGQTTPTTNERNHIYNAAVQVFYTSSMPVGVAPSAVPCPPDRAQVAAIHVTIRRISAPRQAREFTGFVANNGL